MPLQQRLPREGPRYGFRNGREAVAGLVLGVMCHSIASAQAQPPFAERLRIPATSSSQVQFHVIVGTVLEEDGSIMVLDHFNNSVRVFDRTGRLVREFGQMGAGPGEFQQPAQLAVTPDRVYVNDSKANRITWFTRTGEYQGDRHYPARDTDRGVTPYSVYPLRGGQLLIDYATALGNLAGVTNFGPSRIVLLDRAGREVHTFAEYSVGGAYAYARSRPTITVPVGGTFGRGAHAFVAGDSLIVIADAYRGTIRYFEVLQQGVRLLRTRDLKWTPQRAAPTAERVRAHRETAARILRVGDANVVLEYPQFGGAIRTGVLAGTGDLWLRTRAHFRGEVERLTEVFQHEYLVVPWNASQPPYRVTLPRNILLLSVASERILGAHLDSDRVATLRVYQYERGR